MWLINDASWLVDNLLIGIIPVIVFTVGLIIFIFPAVVIMVVLDFFWWFNNEGVRDDYKERLRRNPPPPANVNYVQLPTIGTRPETLINSTNISERATLFTITQVIQKKK